MTSTAVLSPAEAPASGATTWQIDSAHSHVEFAVKHLMIATVKGRFGEVEGTLVIDEANPAASRVVVKIAAASIDTREPNRDGHLRSPDFLDAESHPYLTFVSRHVELRDDTSFTVHGDLTIRGVTRAVTLDAECLGTTTGMDGVAVAGFTATTKINRKDYGLNWNMALETGGVLVGDDIKVTLEIEAKQQPVA